MPERVPPAAINLTSCQYRLNFRPVALRGYGPPTRVEGGRFSSLATLRRG